MKTSLSPYFDEGKATDFLGLKNRGTLSNWRSQGTGPPYTRLNGGRTIRYKLSDLEAFMAKDRIDPGAGK